MKRNVLAYLLLLVLLLTACGRWQKADMLRQLNELQAMNQADSLLTNDSLAKALASYFDDYGTPNERMLAHYLLARTYTDMGEAPQALDEYHTAADCADTTAADCDYLLLYKVLGQMGTLLFSYKLLPHAQQAFDKAQYYALKQGLDRYAIIAFEQKARCYYAMGYPDSAAFVMKKSNRMLLQMGDTLTANAAIGPLSYIYSQKGNLSKAKECIDCYSNSIISRDSFLYPNEWMLFQIQKGYYYNAKGDLDSALYYFRHGLNNSNTLNNKFLSIKGLYEVYKKLEISDSISKYAILRTETNDSTVNIQITENLQAMQAVYDYKIFKTLADEALIKAERIKAERSFWAFLAICFLLIVLAGTVVGYYIYERKRQQLIRMNRIHATNILLYEKTSAELRNMLLEKEEDKRRLSQAEHTISYLKRNIQARSDTEAYESELMKDTLLGSEIVQILKTNALHGKELQESYWVEYNEAIHAYLPDFASFLDSLQQKIETVEMRICMLVLLQIPQKEKATLLGITPSHYAMKRKRLYARLFGSEGTADEFDKKIQIMASSEG